MSYIEITTGQYPVTEREIRSQFHNTSFPSPFVAPEPYALVFEAPRPEHDKLTQIVREIAPVLTAKGHFEQQWEVVSRFTEYTDEAGVTHTVVEQEAAAVVEHQTKEAERIRTEIMDGVQRYLDDFARTKTYDSILSACTYATSLVPKFAAEGQYCVSARDTCWGVVAQIEAEVLAGTRPVPTGFEEIKPELPVLAWPQ